jgi:hypothetical protein
MKPFLLGKKTLGTAPLRPPVSTPSPLSGACAHPREASATSAGPTVEAVREGDKVVRLIVTCTCGERIEVDCLYPPGV